MFRLLIAVYFLLHLIFGLPFAIFVGIVGLIIDRTFFYLEMEISDWLEEWLNWNKSWNEFKQHFETL
jgi:hypothetical protein